MHGCLDNGSLATSSYLRNANIKTYVEECIKKPQVQDYSYRYKDRAVLYCTVCDPIDTYAISANTGNKKA